MSSAQKAKKDAEKATQSAELTTALRQLRVSRVVFGAANDKFGGCGSVLSLHADASPCLVALTHPWTVKFHQDGAGEWGYRVSDSPPDTMPKRYSELPLFRVVEFRTSSLGAHDAAAAAQMCARSLCCRSCDGCFASDLFLIRS